MSMPGRFAGRPYAEDVGGLERGFVKAHGAVEDGPGVCSKDLEGKQVGGRKSYCAQVSEVLKDGHAEGTPFLGIGGSAELIKEDKGIGGCVLDHAFDAGNVGGERAEALLDGLLVSDVGEDLIEDGESRLGSWYRECCVRHQG